eukprot:1836437-Rhodomonas_salina.2
MHDADAREWAAEAGRGAVQVLEDEVMQGLMEVKTGRCLPCPSPSPSPSCFGCSRNTCGIRSTIADRLRGKLACHWLHASFAVCAADSRVAACPASSLTR